VSDDEREFDAKAAERLTFFSDAVVAIAITLLAIDLPVPEGSTLSKFLTSVGHDDGHYVAFLISFAAIAAAWFDHHDLFRYVRGTDARLKVLNIWWLLSIVLNPFATKLLIVSGQSLSVHARNSGSTRCCRSWNRPCCTRCSGTLSPVGWPTRRGRWWTA
jgi:uncharacterized membrane protein